MPERQVIASSVALAESLIERWYGRRVHFAIGATQDVDSYQSRLMGRGKIPPYWLNFRYAFGQNDSVARFLAQISVGPEMERFATSAVRGGLPSEYQARLGNPRENAGLIFRIYAEKLAALEGLELGGRPLLDPTHWQRNSYGYWESALSMIEPEDVRDHLLITNTPLIDDNLRTAPVHSLVRGGLLNGFALPSFSQVIVSTFPLFSEEPLVASLRDGALTDSERIQALAQVIAHEVGTHVLMQWKDVYDHAGCLAEPVRGLEYRRSIARLKAPRCVGVHGSLDMKDDLGDRYAILAECLVAGGDTEAAWRALEKGLLGAPDHPRLAHLRSRLTP